MQFAKMADEKVGGVYERNSDRFANFKSALDDLVKNGIVGTPYAGGISKCDIELRKCNPDSVNKSVEYGDASAMVTTVVTIGSLTGVLTEWLLLS